MKNAIDYSKAIDYILTLLVEKCTAWRTRVRDKE
jgi:hypothetical protein